MRAPQRDAAAGRAGGRGGAGAGRCGTVRSRGPRHRCRRAGWRPPRRAAPLLTRGRGDSAGTGCGTAAGAGGCGLGPWHLRCRCPRSCPELPGPAGSVSYRVPARSAVRAADRLSFCCVRFFRPFPLLFLPFLPFSSVREPVFLSLFPCFGLSFFFFFFFLMPLSVFLSFFLFLFFCFCLGLFLFLSL